MFQPLRHTSVKEFGTAARGKLSAYQRTRRQWVSEIPAGALAKALTFPGRIITLYIDYLCNRLTMEKGKTRKKAEMVPGTLEMLILKTLERNREPMHGYGVAQYLRRTTSDVLQVEEGSLYPALQRLAINGWVKAEWGQSEKNHRARFYKLTPAGRKRLKQEVADFERVLEAILRVVQPAGGAS